MMIMCLTAQNGAIFSEPLQPWTDFPRWMREVESKDMILYLGYKCQRKYSDASNGLIFQMFSS
jgi:hypothetical protein